MAPEDHDFSILSFILFIGAPLGGIIRKGGLGMPVIVSVLTFIIYYIIDNTGYKWPVMESGLCGWGCG